MADLEAFLASPPPREALQDPRRRAVFEFELEQQLDEAASGPAIRSPKDARNAPPIVGVPGIRNFRRTLQKRYRYRALEHQANILEDLFLWLRGIQPASGKTSNGVGIVARTAVRLYVEGGWVLRDAVRERVYLKGKELNAAYWERRKKDQERLEKLHASLDPRPPTPGDEGATQMATTEIRRCVRAAVADLPSPLRAVAEIRLREGQDRMTLTQIDDVLGLPDGTAKRRWRKIRRELQQRLG